MSALRMYSINMNNNDNELFSVLDFLECEETAARADSDTEEKIQHEIHRMMGFLRFTPDENGEFTARCEPDHHILPMLAEYFTARFGETAWSIIDEKRGLCLRRLPGEEAKINVCEEAAPENRADKWEELWKHYHKTINNEDRCNPQLQRQFMPKRYWKYLPEM